MWNPWDLTLGQALSLIFVFGWLGWVMQKLLDELQRIRKAVESIRFEMSKSNSIQE